MKLCFVDTETTGTNSKENSIFELAAIIDIDGEYSGRFCENAKPFDGDVISKEALDKTGKAEEEIWSYSNDQGDLKLLYQKWLEEFVDPMDKTDKLHLVGYNAEFDYRFMRTLWEELEDKYFGSYFWFPYIDMMTILGWAMIKQRSELKNFKLYTIAHSMGVDVDPDKLHGAMYDCRLVRKLYYKMEE